MCESMQFHMQCTYNDNKHEWLSVAPYAMVWLPLVSENDKIHTIRQTQAKSCLRTSSRTRRVKTC